MDRDEHGWDRERARIHGWDCLASALRFGRSVGLNPEYGAHVRVGVLAGGTSGRQNCRACDFVSAHRAFKVPP